MYWYDFYKIFTFKSQPFWYYILTVHTLPLNFMLQFFFLRKAGFYVICCCIIGEWKMLIMCFRQCEWMGQLLTLSSLTLGHHTPYLTSRLSCASPSQSTCNPLTQSPCQNWPINSKLAKRARVPACLPQASRACVGVSLAPRGHHCLCLWQSLSHCQMTFVRHLPGSFNWYFPLWTMRVLLITCLYFLAP